MQVDTRIIGDDRVLIVRMSAKDLPAAIMSGASFPEVYHSARRSGHLDKVVRSWTTLNELIVSAIRSEQSPNRFAVPLVAIDFSEANPQTESFEQWIHLVFFWKSIEFFNCVSDRAGKIVFCGFSSQPNCEGRPINLTLTLQDAIEDLRKYKAGLKADFDVAPADVLNQLGSLSICLVGCPTKDLGELPEEFRKFGIDVSSVDEIADRDRVVFVISALHGPTDGTRRSVESLRGKTIVPIAIVLAYADMVTDDSLRSLVNLEERELLMKALPENVVDDLPLLLDVDPYLVNRVVDLARNTVTEVRCLTDI